MFGHLLDIFMKNADAIANQQTELLDLSTIPTSLYSALNSHPKDPTTHMNVMNHISAYRTPSDRTFWCFDEPRFGLVQELFMHGASAFISSIVGDECERAEVIFSTILFPGANCILSRVWDGTRVVEAGCEYTARYPLTEKGDDQGRIIEQDGVWLCPAMTHYFGTGQAPETIYGKITAKA